MLEVITPSQTEDLTTLETVKADLKITGTAQDDNLSRYISDASAICADYCNTTFGKATYRQTWFDGGDGTDKLQLPRRPIVSVASVIEADKTLDADTDYAIDKANGLLYRLPKSTGWSWTQGTAFALWGWHGGTIVVEYTAGYDLLDSLPREIERACLAVIRDVFYTAGRDPSVARVSIPGVIERGYSATRGDVSTDAALPRAVTDMLERHRNLFATPT